MFFLFSFSTLAFILTMLSFEILNLKMSCSWLMFNLQDKECLCGCICSMWLLCNVCWGHGCEIKELPSLFLFSPWTSHFHLYSRFTFHELICMYVIHNYRPSLCTSMHPFIVSFWYILSFFFSFFFFCQFICDSKWETFYPVGKDRNSLSSG